MRKFKTVEELEQERQEALGLIPFRMPTDKLILIYARQSTKGQAIKNRESALQQTEEQLARALELGWSEEKRLLFIENQMKDGTVRSASGRLRIDEREGLSTTMFYINNGDASAVMARDVARFFRDEDLVGPVVFAKTCKEHHVLVITDDCIYNFNDPKRGRDDYKKFLAEAQAAADFLEKHQKGVMLKNRDRKARRGEFWGHNVPAGLMLDDERKFYIPNPYWAEPVTKLFKRFRALGGDINAMRREVVGTKIFPDLPPEIMARVGYISLQRVDGGYTIKSREGLVGILTNPAYIGDIYYNGKLVKEGAHKAIVDEEDFLFAFYRLSPTDFDGTPIERPEGVTKRYTQKRKLEPIQTLLSGLRSDGTPVVTTNAGPKAGVYVQRNYPHLEYLIEDRSKITIHPDCTRLSVRQLDEIFSERIVYRAGEALRNAGQVQSDQPLESTRLAIHAQLLETMSKVEQSKNEQKKSPLQVLEEQIAETTAKIAEKVRVSEVATADMDDVDLQRHFRSLKNLRQSLADLERKKGQLKEVEEDKAKAKQMLPDVYSQWSSMDMEEKQRFIRVATSRVTLDKIAAGWFRFTIEWAPLLNEDKAGETLIDEGYVFSPSGSDAIWTDEELTVLEEHYATATRPWLMERLPQRSWQAIRRMGQRKDLSRPNVRRCGNENKLTRWLSVSEMQLLQEHDICAEEILEKRIAWKEYLDKEYTDMAIIENKEGLYSQSKSPAWP